MRGGSQTGSSKKPPPIVVPTTVLQPPAVTSPIAPPPTTDPAATTQASPSGKTTTKPGGLVSTSPETQTISSAPKNVLSPKAQSEPKIELAVAGAVISAIATTAALAARRISREWNGMAGRVRFIVLLRKEWSD